jgi:hypothetical protein
VQNGVTRRRAYGTVLFAGRAIAGAGLTVCLLFVFQAVASAGESGGRKYYGFSEEIMPGGVDSKGATMPAEDLKEKQSRKQELLRQMGYKEDIMKLQVSAPPREETPLKRPESAAQPEVSETPLVNIAVRVPEIQGAPDYNDVIKKAVYRAEDIEFSAAKTADETLVHVPVGTTIMAKQWVDAARKIYGWINGKVSDAQKEAGHKKIKIEIEEMPEAVRSSLGPLLEVQGVSVKVPGADYALASVSENARNVRYDLKEDVFTIDKIALEKTKKGELVVKVPSDVVRDFDKKKLCLSEEKDPGGKTVAMKLAEGDVKVLANVLAAWAKYSPSGFHLDAAAEEKVAKAVIRLIGVGMQDAVVRLEEEEIYSKALESEIDAIVGADSEAKSRIMEYIRGRGAARR